MERSIPHVRDIFAPYRSATEPAHDKIHVYEHSPGSRRRRHHDPKDDPAPQDFIDTDHSDSTDESPANNNRESSRVRDKSRHNANRNSFTDMLYDKNDMNASKGGYSSKTLTERDIRHLERHLSMKKTIRKQISRNLAQAFVDDTVVFQGDNATPVVVPLVPIPPPQTPTNNTNYSFTLTRAKMAARSEHTFLDMLKKDSNRGGASEADSGHSSPTHQGGFEDEPPTMMEVDYEANQYTPYNGRSEPTIRSEQQQIANDQHKKHSFWKKFGFKGKGKR